MKATLLVVVTVASLLQAAVAQAARPEPIKFLDASPINPANGEVFQTAAAADVNRDGLQDIVGTLGDSADIHVFYASGPALAFEDSPYRAGVDAVDAGAADFNNDGWPDLYARDAGDSVTVRLSQKSSFDGPQIVHMDSSNRLQVADVNGDGNLDLIGTADSYVGSDFTDYAYISVAFGDGTGHFPRVTNQFVNASWRMVFGDLNGDGKTDALGTICPGGDPNAQIDCPISVVVMYGHGDGSFSGDAPIPLDHAATGPSSALAIADINGDGQADAVLATDHGWHSSAQAQVVLLLGKAGSLQRAADATSGWIGAASLAIGDLNKDGHTDLVVGDLQPGSVSQSISVLLGRGDGSFEPSTTIFQPGGILTLADLDGNGTLDILSGDDWGTWISPNETGRCVVPDLTGETVAGARSTLRHSDCSLGAVRHRYTRTIRRGRIVSQSRGFGRTFAGGASVAVTVSLGRRLR